MLSRIAESLFWIGRYVERADDTARILDIYLQRILEDSSLEADACRILFDVMGRPAETTDPSLDVRTVLDQLAYDIQSPSSITGALASARVNARSARDSVSSEVWEALNLTFLELGDQQRMAIRTPHKFFQWARQRTGLVAGIADSSMSRDEGWQFMVLGRYIERADMTARLISTGTAPGSAAPSWRTLLSSCGAYEAYLRTYRGRVSDLAAAEFLLLDRLFPRSLFFALYSAEQILTELDRGERRVGTTDLSARLLGRARSRLEWRGMEEMIDDLPERLESIQAACAEATSALGVRYFPHATVEWLGKGA